MASSEWPSRERIWIIRDKAGVEVVSLEETELPTGLTAFPYVPASHLDELRDALKPVAAVADRLAAKGQLEVDPAWGDEDLTFPSDVELSVADLKRARNALSGEQGVDRG